MEGVYFGFGGAPGEGGEAGASGGGAGGGVWSCPHNHAGIAHRHNTSHADREFKFTYVLTGRKAGFSV